jgi:hypothetical protein
VEGSVNGPMDEENHLKLQSGHPVSRPRFEQSTSRIQALPLDYAVRCGTLSHVIWLNTVIFTLCSTYTNGFCDLDSPI